MDLFDFSSLSNTELLVYDYIKQNIEHASDFTLRGVASGAHVSTATVLRCLNKIGYKKFSTFKTDIISDNKIKSLLQLSSEEPPLTQTLRNFFNRPLEKMFNKSIQNIAQLILSADTIFFFGTGTSGMVADYGKTLFNNYGFPAFSLSYAVPVEDFKKALPSSVAILLSVTGMTGECLNHASTLKTKGCKVISITSSPTCKLANISDFNISYETEVERMPNGADISTQVPSMFLIESIARKANEISNQTKLSK